MLTKRLLEQRSPTGLRVSTFIFNPFPTSARLRRPLLPLLRWHHGSVASRGVASVLGSSVKINGQRRFAILQADLLVVGLHTWIFSVLWNSVVIGVRVTIVLIKN